MKITKKQIAYFNALAREGKTKPTLRWRRRDGNSSGRFYELNMRNGLECFIESFWDGWCANMVDSYGRNGYYRACFDSLLAAKLAYEFLLSDKNREFILAQADRLHREGKE